MHPTLVVRSFWSRLHPLRGPRDQTSQQPPETPRDFSRDLNISHSEPASILAINVYLYLSSES